MGRSIIAAGAYFAVVFLAGMVIGTALVLVAEPALGGVGAVMAEIPLMLAVAWLTCAVIVSRLAVPPRRADRLMMGGIAFLLLMAAELGLDLWRPGSSIADHFTAYREPARAIGLVGQILFGLFPLLMIGRRARMETGHEIDPRPNL